ncbi:LysM peptidoglycan-binding domain-containing protein [Catenulispora pinisilvae]|uniref:LysM peptidoglycan-binding domain-containing protein n=1 Tax=Catenulispora pinisilvae TaxID=2705253 RepID=UPI001E52FDBE|nr:LysM peptidoglycan-binding domain-containing protein [Catenulispora pinisilvae]
MAEDGGVAGSRPGSSTASGPEAPEYQTYVVRRGDSLWRIAEEQLGDPNRFADIAELNDGRRMPDGTVFSYVEFLQSGWVLIMPPDMGRHRPELTPEPVQLAIESGIGTAVSALARRESTFATTGNDSGKTVAATGGLLAAGVLSALGDRRLRKLTRRRPGERISMRRPGDWELELSRIDNPTGQVLIDAALRTLSAKLTKADRGLPDISATVLKRHGLELHLARPQPPVAPFYADPRRPGVWICPLGAPVGAPPAPAPYPALVSLGFDEDDDTVMVDLEATGGISLLAPEAESVSVLRAMAVELATGMAADQVEVTLVGFGEELPPLFAPGRLTSGDDLVPAVEALARWSAGVEAVLDRRGVTVRKARTHPDDELAPITKTHVLLSAVPPDPRLTHRLRHLLSGRQRTSVAVVAVAADREQALSPWTIGGPMFHTPRSQSGVPGIPLRVQALREDRFEAVVRELSAADSDQEKPAPREGAFHLPASARPEGPGAKTPLPKRKPSHPRRHVAGNGDGAGSGALEASAAASGSGSAAGASRPPARAELIPTPDPVQPNRFRVPVDDLFRVDALLPTALPTTTAPLPGPGTAKAVRLALKPANLPQFDPVADGDEEPPPPRAEDRLVGIDDDQPDSPTRRDQPALPTRDDQPALSARSGYLAARDRSVARETTPRKPGQWHGAYWSQRKAAAAGMAKPGASNPAETDDLAAAPTYTIDILGPIVLAGDEGSAELAEVAAYVMLHPGCSVQQLATELWPAHAGAMTIIDAQLVRLREVLGPDEQLLRVTPESVTLAPAVTCDWLEFLHRTQTGELVGALSLVRGRPFEDAPLRRYGWAETLRHEIAALAIDTAHYVAEACLHEQSPRNARKAALRGLAAAPESELLYRDLLTALGALSDRPAARRHADALLGYAEREGLPLQPETAALLRDVAQAASRG